VGRVIGQCSEPGYVTIGRAVEAAAAGLVALLVCEFARESHFREDFPVPSPHFRLSQRARIEGSKLLLFCGGFRREISLDLPPRQKAS